MNNKFYINLLTIFGIGKIKYAPGTFASIFACLFYFYLFSQKANFFAILIFYFFLIILSINLIDRLSKKFKKNDPKEIVIDEFIGQSLVLVLLPLTYQNYILGFVFFRFFDIYKPIPIKYFEKKYQNAFGVIFDDVIAAGYALLAIYIINIIIL